MDIPDIERVALSQGWKLIRAKKHNVWRSPEGHIVVTAKSPSDRRAQSNIKARFTRAGLEL